MFIEELLDQSIGSFSLELTASMAGTRQDMEIRLQADCLIASMQLLALFGWHDFIRFTMHDQQRGIILAQITERTGGA